MKALILAAGRGGRLGSEAPKCLLEVGGRSLLERMLAALVPFVDEALLVSGFQADELEAAAEACPVRPPLRFVRNPDYLEGSVVSLGSGLASLAADGSSSEGLAGRSLLVMDADVLFPRELLRRLVEDAPASAFLLDPRGEAGGEEMMLVARGGRVIRIARRVAPEPGDRCGEGVGFLKLTPPGQALLAREVEALLAAGQRGGDYEGAVDRLLAHHPMGYVEVGDLPWTEVDFPEDLARARAEILPRLA